MTFLFLSLYLGVHQYDIFILVFVSRGPENIDVFSENYHMPSLEETPDEILQARQKIKDLLLQPVQTSYVGSSNMVQHSIWVSARYHKTVAVRNLKLK